MRIWAIANQKGGVGKTTTTAALGGLLAASGARTLLVDMDPHASLSGYFGHDDGGRGVYDLFADGAAQIPALARTTRYAQLSLLTSTASMATLDRQHGNRGGMGLVLAEALKRCAGQYDRVLIDCPPLLGVLMINALAASERLLIPTQTEFLALQGLERMLRTLDMVQRSRRTPLDHRIVPTLYDMRTHASRSCLEHLRQRYGARVVRNEIPVDTQLREASLAGVPAGQWAAARRGAPSYQLLLDELLELEHREEEAVA